MKQSKRNRAKPRTTTTYQNKLNKLKSHYNRLFKHSTKAKEAYMALPEADRKPKNKVFFVDKYPKFDKFLSTNKLKQVGKERDETVYRSSKPTAKTGVWGR